MSEGLYRFFRPIFTFLMKVLFRPEILNKDNIVLNGGVILAGNHKNAIDPCLVGASTKRTIHFLAKKELHQGLKGLFFRNVGTIPVDRSKKDKNTTDMAEKALLEGKIINLFPEGTRNKTSEMLLPFKFGAVSLSKKTNVKIIPFGIKGKYKLFRKGIKIEFGQPIDISNMELQEANQYLMEKVKELMQK